MSLVDQPTVPTRPPDPARSTPPGVWVAPSVEELQAKLPQYEVLEILGRGGMGAVYKARQKSLKRLVAIKILPLGMADDEFKFVERFQNEAQTMAQMNHPAIVSVYDFGETSDGLLYFVMEFVDGTDVHKMIQSSGRLSGEHALAITAHVCDALSYAHKRGVIHRDIKPANILIDQEGHIKVADFGLAKMHDPSQTSGLTKTNMAMGTPDYVAPEVLSPGMVADHRADLYAVGVMLYQMLTGEVPRGMFKLPSQKGIRSDERFDAIICKAMEQDREERYQSAMDVRRDLDVILTTPQPKNDGAGIVSAKAVQQKPASSKASAPTTMWLLIGGSAAVLGVAAFLVFGGKSSSPVSDKPNQDAVSPPQAMDSTAPTTANWQDVTHLLRESVRTKTGFTVDTVGVHRAAGAPIGDTMVMGPSEKDRAVRVRYTSQTQVSLWFKGGTGSAYVLAADKSTMFKKQSQKVGEGVSMVQSVVHPAGFDLTRPHELIVAVQGNVFRVWLDGRYLAQAEDSALRECSIAIVPMKNSTVQKVEVAEIEGASSKGEWQPIFMKPEDFGGDLRDVEFRDGAVFLMERSHLAPPSITAIRSTLRFFGSDRTGSVSLRSTEGAAYGEEDFACMVFVSPSGGVVMKVRDRTTGNPELKRHDFPLSPALKLEESFTFELRAADGKITASINGHEVGSVPDTWKGGARRFSITPSTTEMTEFRDVAVMQTK